MSTANNSFPKGKYIETLDGEGMLICLNLSATEPAMYFYMNHDGTRKVSNGEMRKGKLPNPHEWAGIKNSEGSIVKKLDLDTLQKATALYRKIEMGFFHGFTEEQIDETMDAVLAEKNVHFTKELESKVLSKMASN